MESYCPREGREDSDEKQIRRCNYDVIVPARGVRTVKLYRISVQEARVIVPARGVRTVEYASA